MTALVKPAADVPRPRVNALNPKAQVPNFKFWESYRRQSKCWAEKAERLDIQALTNLSEHPIDD